METFRSTIDTIYNLLPDFSGILLASVGVALVIAPPEVWFKRIGRGWRVAIAIALVALGVLGMFSSSTQHKDAEAAQRGLGTKLDDLQRTTNDLEAIIETFGLKLDSMIKHPTSPEQKAVATALRDQLQSSIPSYDPNPIGCPQNVAESVGWALSKTDGKWTLNYLLFRDAIDARFRDDVFVPSRALRPDEVKDAEALMLGVAAADPKASIPSPLVTTTFGKLSEITINESVLRNYTNGENLMWSYSEFSNGERVGPDPSVKLPRMVNIDGLPKSIKPKIGELDKEARYITNESCNKALYEFGSKKQK